MDAVLWAALQQSVGTTIPKGDHGLGWDCPLTAPVDQWRGRSYQELKARLPARSGGLGLPSLVDLRRDWAVYQAERGRQERAAHWILRTRGYRVLQRGAFMET